MRMETCSIKGCMVVTAIVAAGTAVCLSPLSAAFALPISLGGAAGYAVVGEGGSVGISDDFKIYQSATVINGNVAEGPYTTLAANINATVNGRWDYDTTDLNPCTAPGGGCTGTVTGGFHQIDLSGVVADGRAAANAYAALTPTQTFTTLSEGQTITGGPGVNVIRITGDVTLKTSLTISGPAGSSFIFQLTTADTGHILTLSGMQMYLTGGVTAGDIVWDLKGAGGDIVVNSGANVFGIFLAPDRQFVGDHAIINGEVIAGGSGTFLSIHSGSEITSPSQQVPEPTSLLLLGFGLAGLGLWQWKRRRELAA